MVLAALVITLREGTEASLVIAAVSAYLKQIGRRDLNKYIYGGSVAGLAASFALAGVFALFREVAQGIQGFFEAGTMFLASIVLSYVLIWMARHARRLGGAMEDIKAAVSKGQVVTIATVAFTSVLREGVEAVLLLAAMAIATSALDTMTGALLGLASAIVIGVSLIKGSYRVKVRTFFKYTSILLVLIGAMVTAHGVEGLQEAGILPILTQRAYDVNPLLPTSLQEQGVLGSLIHAFIGFHYAPSILALITQIAYILLIGTILWKTYGFAVRSGPETGAPHTAKL